MCTLCNPVRFSSLVQGCVHTRYKPKEESGGDRFHTCWVIELSLEE